MKHLFLLKEFFKYKLKASSAHGIHSPFVYEFITKVLEDKRHFYAFDEIKALRNQLNSDLSKIQIQDFGAGSHLNTSQKRMVKDIAKTAGRTEKFGELLFRICQKYQPTTILELGTSLGLATSYLSKGNTEAYIHTIEGSPEISQKATVNFDFLQLKNIIQYTGNFDDLLLPCLRKIKSVDLFFVDGNHRKEPTLQYFEQALPFSHNDSIFIFDDIHWSQGMQEAWEKIKSHPKVTLTIDLFFIGMVFFKSEFKEKQHFVLKY